ncbi:MAG: hypothetical protein IT259_19705 [Saprospiraceae bacterium]|nr:hypothetical protein [Saprospiraceae bacterium]
MRSRICLCCLLFTFGSFAQGPIDGYLKGRGRLDIAPSFSFNNARNFAGAGGQTYPVGYRGSMLSLFAEYGLTDNFDLVANAAYVFTQTQSGLQDGGVFVKYRPYYHQTQSFGRIGVVVSAGCGFPLSDYDVTLNGALGQKAVTVPGRLVLQWETPWGPFINLTGGYHWRLDQLKTRDIERIRVARPDYEPVDPPDFSTFLVKAGLPARHFYLDGWIEWQFTRGGADYVPDVPDLPQAYGVSYQQIGGTAYYSESGKNGVFLSGAYITGGRNVSRIGRITAGLVVKL